MSYGLQIIGNDNGGNFTVADTDLSMVNMIVTQVGSGSSIVIEGGLQDTDLIFVKSPRATGGGDWQVGSIEVLQRGNIYFNNPFVYGFRPDFQNLYTYNFYGAAWQWVTSNHIYGDRDFYVYDQFEVVMDYFVVRKASTVIDLNLHTNDDYGLQLWTEGGELALDSRSFTSDKTFYIESYLPPESNFGVLNQSGTQSLSYSAGSYVNIEWALTGPSINNPSFNEGASGVSGLHIGPTSAWTIDGDVTSQQGGEPTLQIWSSHNAIFAAKLGTNQGSPSNPDGGDEEPPDQDPDEITGTIEYSQGSSNTIVEGDTLSFDVQCSEVSNYHTRVFRLSGSNGADGKDFVSVTQSLPTTDSQTVTLSTYNPTTTTPQTFDKIYSNSYTGTYTRERTSSYLNSNDTSYTRTFLGNYTGNYSRTITSERDFVNTYTRTLISSREIVRPSAYAGEYSRNFTRTSTRVSSYSRPLSYVGNYTGNYERTSTRTRNSILTSSRIISRTSAYAGEYSRNFTRTSTRVSSYSRPLSYVGNFGGNYTRDYTRAPIYTGNYTRGFSQGSSYIGNYLATTPIVENGETFYFPTFFVSYYTRSRPSSYSATYTRTRTVLDPNVVDYTRNSTRTRSSSFTRSSSRTRVSAYTRTRTFESVRTLYYSANYSRDFVGNYIPTVDYIGDYTGNFAGNYTGTISYTGNFTRDFVDSAEYTRNSTSTSTRDFTTSYSRSAISTRTFIGDYVGTQSYSRTVSAFSYSASPKTYWKEEPDTESGPNSGGPSDTLTLLEVSVYSGGTLLASTTTTTMANLTLVNSLQGYWHKGTLQNTIGDIKYYSIANTSTFAPPTGTTTNYTRDFNYTRNSVVNYTGTVPYTRTRVSSYIGDFTGNYVSGAVRTSTYSDGYTRDSVYTRTRIGYFAGNYTGISTRVLGGTNGEPETTVPAIYARVRNSIYSRTSTKVSTYTSNFIGNYTRDFAGNYVGDYARGYAGDYVGNYERTLYYARNFIGNYSRSSTRDFVGDYARGTTSTFTRTRFSTLTRYSTYTRNPQYVGNYERAFTRLSTRTRPTTLSYSRTLYFTGNYSRDYSGAYTRDFSRTVNYSSDFIGNFVGNYERTSTRNRPTTLSYTRTLYYTGDYARDYSGAYSRDFSKISTYSQVLSFVGNYTGTFTRSSIYVGDYERNRTSSYARGAFYTRTFTASYVGDYVSSRTTQSTRNVLDTPEIGWQGERFVIELRRGSDTAAMSAPRGDSNVEVLDSKEFTLIDNDIGLFVSMSPLVVHHTATSHQLTYDFFAEGTTHVPARIIRGSSIIVPSYLLINNGRTNLTISEVPPQGSSYTYKMEVFDGNSWVLASYYTVSRILDTDYVPPTPTYTTTYTNTTPTYYTNTYTPNTNLN